MTLSAMTNLMCRGRKRGLAGIVATQRLAKLAKNVAAEASNFLMGRTFLDIDMQRAADLLGMDRRQAERIRDLQCGHFLGLGPAVSRRPVAVHIGDVKSGGKNGASALMPLPQTGAAEMGALLHADLAEEVAAPAPARPLPPPRPDVEALAQTILARAEGAGAPAEGKTEAKTGAETEAGAEAKAKEGAGKDTGADTGTGTGTGANGIAPAQAGPSRQANLSERPVAAGSIDSVLADMAAEDGATFRPAAQLFRDFAMRCRQQGIASAHIDMPAFRRLFAFASAGMNQLDPGPRAQIEALAAHVDDDVLAPYLAICIAAAAGRKAPDEDALARAYGTASPGRIRRLLDHLEKTGLIAVHEDFGGSRTITVPGIETAGIETASF
jgi:hypothetical protein